MTNALTTGVARTSLGVTDLDAAIDFYATVWGLELVSTSGDLAYLAAVGSESAYVLRLRKGDANRLDLIAMATPDTRTLADVVGRAEHDGWMVVEGPHPMDEPGGGVGARLLDPEGRPFEIVTDIASRRGSRTLRPTESVPARLSHVVVNSPDPDSLAQSYETVLGLQVSDFLGDKMVFMRATNEHHAVAIGRCPHVSVNHIAYEVIGVDEFMRATGRLIRSGHELLWGPGRHGPGDNTFAYFHDPNGFIAEFTTGLELIEDPDSWEPRVWQSVPEQSDLWGTSNARPGPAFVGLPDPGTGTPPPY